MRATRWAGLSLLASLTLLPSCERRDGFKPAVTVAPALELYSEAFELQLADELDAMAAPCHRQDPAPGCSAAATFIIDGIGMRRQIRAPQE